MRTSFEVRIFLFLHILLWRVIIGMSKHHLIHFDDEYDC